MFGRHVGAVGIFLATRLAFADYFRARAGGWVKTLADGFTRDAFSYMLFLRLVPAVPFVVVNIVPAISACRSGLRAVDACRHRPRRHRLCLCRRRTEVDLIAERAAACAANAPPCGTPLAASSLVTPEIVIALVLLSLLALLPVVIRHLKAR